MGRERGQGQAGGGTSDTKQERTILLVSSTDLRWVGLKSVLREIEHVRVVGETPDSEAALEVAQKQQPHGVITDVNPGSGTVVQLAQQLRIVSPASRLMVLGHREHHVVLHELRILKVWGYMLWEDATPGAVRQMLTAVLEAGLWAGSLEAADDLVGSPGSSPTPPGGRQFTDRERLVLRGLARGLSEREIAEATGIGLRTFERMIPDLEYRFSVNTLYDLRLEAHDRGFGL